MNFIDRQSDLRRDLSIMLRGESFRGNRTALAIELGVVPKVLGDFLNGAKMHAEKYDELILKMLDFRLTFSRLDLASCIRVLDNISNEVNVERNWIETYEETHVERYKLFDWFLFNKKKQSFTQIKSDLKTVEFITEGERISVFAEKIKSTNHDDSFLKQLVKCSSEDPFDRHEKLASYKKYFVELEEVHNCFLYGFRIPSYLLDKDDVPKASVIYAAGDEWLSLRKDAESNDLTEKQRFFCADINYSPDKDTFTRSLAKGAISPAKMQK
ncbi:hypothetical protein N9V24_01080 [Pseudomonadota bacterium]|nr:hypothetical protein [Pseudomonadota bacterium]